MFNNIKNYTFLIIVLAVMLVYSCKKDTINDNQPKSEVNYDTLFPLDYLPVFPGSWWKYNSSNGDVTYLRTDSVYQIDSYTINAEGFVSDTFYVPVYNGQPMWGYDANTGYPLSHAGSTPFKTVLSDTLPVGSSWLISHWAGTGISRKITARDTAIIIGSTSYFPTIVVEEYFSEGPINYTWIARRYYTKDIGMVKEELFQIQDSTVSGLVLDDYFVNL